MKKKYIQPEIEVQAIETKVMIAASVVNSQEGVNFEFDALDNYGDSWSWGN